MQRSADANVTAIESRLNAQLAADVQIAQNQLSLDNQLASAHLSEWNTMQVE